MWIGSASDTVVSLCVSKPAQSDQVAGGSYIGEFLNKSAFHSMQIHKPVITFVLVANMLAQRATRNCV
jgi:hypothetical protein